jgi:hypothetical protein
VISLTAVNKAKKKKVVKQPKNNDKKLKGGITGKGWVKGQSGNPNGRPKNEFALNEHIKEIANTPVGKSKKTMLEAVVNTVYQEALGGNMTAVNFLADRILGKPNQSIGIKDTTDEPIKVFDLDEVED